MQNKFITLLICCLLSFAATAQDTLKGNYNSLHLTAKNYYVSEVVTISDNLIIDAGAQLILANSVSVICRSGVSFNGLPDKRISIRSATGQSAQGFVFAAYLPTAINISYTRFEKLLLPINFEYGWYRTAVNIHHNEFIRNTGSTAVMQVLNPAGSLANAKTPVALTLSNNLFAENIAPVYFEDLAGDVMQVKIIDNTFAGNTIRDYGKYTFSSNFLFGRIDNIQSKYTAEIRQNSFSGNALWNSDGDSILHEANMGVYGSIDSVNIPGNYWGEGEENILRRSIYDYTVNYTSPKLVIAPFLQIPGSQLPPHIYKISRLAATNVQRANYRLSNGSLKLSTDSAGTLVKENFDLRSGIQSIELLLNTKPVSRELKVNFYQLRDSLAVVDTLVKYSVDTTYNTNAVIIKYDYAADSLFRTRPGYLVINGLTGQQGEYIPEVKIGYAVFLRLLNERKLEYELKSRKKDSSASLVKPPVPIIVNTKFKSKLELGLMGAYALYYGTLSNKALFKNDYNSFLGVQLRYSLKSHVSVSLSFMKMTLTGSDGNSDDSSKIKRGMSFKTPVTNISFQVEYDFLDNSVYSSRNRIRPSIGFGIDYIKFKPTGEYLGETFDLHSIGTGGQYLPDANNTPYSLSSFGAPITIQARYYLNKKMIYTLFASYHLAFTDYLDDVGPDPYPDAIKIAAANPSNPEAAAYFSNPTKKVVGKNQLRSGLSNGSDSFFTFGFTLAYHF